MHNYLAPLIFEKHCNLGVHKPLFNGVFSTYSKTKNNGYYTSTYMQHITNILCGLSRKYFLVRNLGRDRFTTSNSGGALLPDQFGTSLSRRALQLLHLPIWKREAVDRSNMATMVF